MSRRPAFGLGFTMDKHWHLFGATAALWTVTVFLLVAASVTGEMILAAWAIIVGLHACCTSCWVIVRHERSKVEQFCSGSAAEIIGWIEVHEAEEDCLPMR